MTTNSWGTRATTDGRRRGPAARAAWLVAALGAACGAGPRAAESPPVGVSTVAPARPLDFAFDSIDDRPVSSAAMRGFPAVVTFITTSSLPSQAQVDFLVAMAKHDRDRVKYAAVALEDRSDRELVELYGKALSIPFPLAIADATTLVGAFGDVRAVPVTVILDRTGRVVWRADGRVAKSDELRQALRGL